MSTVQEKINLTPRQSTSVDHNILYFDPLHGRQILIDGLRHHRKCKKHTVSDGKIRNYTELTLVVAGAFAIFGLLVWYCV